MSSLLLAEDDPHIRRVSELALRRDGFDVYSVPDGTAALQLLEQRLFDVIVLDGMMPELDGFDACRRIKANPRTAHIPIIILSARSHAAAAEEGRRAGALAYLCKPFDALALGQRIRQLCKSASASPHGALATRCGGGEEPSTGRGRPGQACPS